MTAELVTMHSTKESTDQYLSPSLSLSLSLFLVTAPSQIFDLGNLWVYGLCCVIWYWVPVYGFDAFIFPIGSLILQFDGFQFFAQHCSYMGWWERADWYGEKRPNGYGERGMLGWALASVSSAIAGWLRWGLGRHGWAEDLEVWGVLGVGNGEFLWVAFWCEGKSRWWGS